jgi:hypothetical protein
MPTFATPFSVCCKKYEFSEVLLYFCWQVSNTFYFTFSLDPECLEPGLEPVVRRVLPATEEEARTFLARYEADHIVHQPAEQQK